MVKNFKIYPTWMLILLVTSDGDSMMKIARKVHVDYHTVSDNIKNILAPSRLINLDMVHAKKARVTFTVDGRFVATLLRQIDTKVDTK